jgi:hypothetical protein
LISNQLGWVKAQGRGRKTEGRRWGGGKRDAEGGGGGRQQETLNAEAI